MANTTGKKFGGRKKGTPNKVTATVRDALMVAFEKAGGVDYLVRMADEEPKAFMTLLARTVPNEISAKVTHHTEAADKLAAARARVTSGQAAANEAA